MVIFNSYVKLPEGSGVPSGNCYIAIENLAHWELIYPKHGDFPVRYANVYQGGTCTGNG